MPGPVHQLHRARRRCDCAAAIECGWAPPHVGSPTVALKANSLVDNFRQHKVSPVRDPSGPTHLSLGWTALTGALNGLLQSWIGGSKLDQKTNSNRVSPAPVFLPLHFVFPRSLCRRSCAFGCQACAPPFSRVQKPGYSARSQVWVAYDRALYPGF